MKKRESATVRFNRKCETVRQAIREITEIKETNPNLSTSVWNDLSLLFRHIPEGDKFVYDALRDEIKSAIERCPDQIIKDIPLVLWLSPCREWPSYQNTRERQEDYCGVVVQRIQKVMTLDTSDVAAIISHGGYNAARVAVKNGVTPNIGVYSNYKFWKLVAEKLNVKQICDLFAESGAILDKHNMNNMPHYPSPEVALYFLQKGSIPADINLTPHYSLIDLAIWTGHLELTTHLFTMGMEPTTTSRESKEKTMRNLIWRAAEHGDSKLMDVCFDYCKKNKIDPGEFSIIRRYKNKRIRREITISMSDLLKKRYGVEYIGYFPPHRIEEIRWKLSNSAPNGTLHCAELMISAGFPIKTNEFECIMQVDDKALINCIIEKGRISALTPKSFLSVVGIASEMLKSGKGPFDLGKSADCAAAFMIIALYRDVKDNEEQIANAWKVIQRTWAEAVKRNLHAEKTTELPIYSKWTEVPENLKTKAQWVGSGQGLVNNAKPAGRFECPQGFFNLYDESSIQERSNEKTKTKQANGNIQEKEQVQPRGRTR